MESKNLNIICQENPSKVFEDDFLNFLVESLLFLHTLRPLVYMTHILKILKYKSPNKLSDIIEKTKDKELKTYLQKNSDQKSLDTLFKNRNKKSSNDQYDFLILFFSPFKRFKKRL